MDSRSGKRQEKRFAPRARRRKLGQSILDFCHTELRNNQFRLFQAPGLAMAFVLTVATGNSDTERTVTCVSVPDL